MTFGKRLRQSRTTKNLTQKQLADLVGAKHNSVSDWENDKNKPDPDTIELLCGVLDISPNYLLNTSEDAYSSIEKEIIKKYRTLDEHGRELVKMILDNETARVEKYGKLTERNDNPIIAPMRLISYYYKNASAGSDQLIIDNLPEKDIEIPDIPEYKYVSYAIGVNGSSMEPVYSDGDILLVEATRELHIGDIGIFQISGQCYVKKLGRTKLISLNEEYPNIPLDETALTQGKVIGKL